MQKTHRFDFGKPASLEGPTEHGRKESLPGSHTGATKATPLSLDTSLHFRLV